MSLPEMPPGVTPEMSAAYDILKDAGYANEKIETILIGCLKNGFNPEHMARKLVRFGKIVSETVEAKK